MILLTYLREALKREAIKRPGIPGILPKMLITMAGIICKYIIHMDKTKLLRS